MRDAAPDQRQTVHRLRDYARVPITVDHVDLAFRLDPRATRVTAKLTCRRQGRGDMVLDGEGLRTRRVSLDGRDLPLPEDGAATMTIPDAPERFTLETEVEIAPAANTALEGLYLSNGMYCTQCEAEGFRRITWMLDRPDVMATYDVSIESDLPVLLSNGDEVGRGRWRDPWPKPTYLFALVAGDLRATEDRFQTMKGRDVALNVWVRPGDEGRADYAMDALKRSMRWDEEVYDLPYDLDVFNIVAVDDFNMGAMENKGLNIFNAAYVLASPETATDGDYANIERIVAHEYFHNWSGNRITCRDWFQLCLKEGLTVFRDQQFSADMRSEAVQRIGDVAALRARQFKEDAGPLAHPVRPDSFVAIDNFYTATVYEKGAEVIRMLRLVVGPKGYTTACDLYFDRYDGQAVTIEDWLRCFEDACDTDLGQFMRWYTQAGTPRVAVRQRHADGVWRMDLRQEVPPTPGQRDKAPHVLPLAFGLLDAAGAEIIPTRVHVMTAEAETVEVETADPPVLSILRGFSAPVILDDDRTDSDRLTLLAHDTDPFSRWEAGRQLSKDRLMRHFTDDRLFDAAWLDALRAAALDEAADPAFRATVLGLPSEDDLAQSLHEAGVVPDPDAIHGTRRAALDALATRLSDDLPALRHAMATPGPYDPRAEDAGRRALDATALSLVTRLDGGAAARAAFEAADNMTDRMAAFTALLAVGDDWPVDRFADEWGHERLVMNKWFAAQASLAPPDRAVATVEQLTARDDFDAANPNRMRAVLGGFAAGNPAGFHRADGSGYRLLAGWLARIDAGNPQLAARMVTPFQSWRRYDADRQAMMREAMEGLRGGASRNLREMVDRILAA